MRACVRVYAGAHEFLCVFYVSAYACAYVRVHVHVRMRRMRGLACVRRCVCTCVRVSVCSLYASCMLVCVFAGAHFKHKSITYQLGDVTDILNTFALATISRHVFIIIIDSLCYKVTTLVLSWAASGVYSLRSELTRGDRVSDVVGALSRRGHPRLRRTPAPVPVPRAAALRPPRLRVHRPRPRRLLPLAAPARSFATRPPAGALVVAKRRAARPR